MNATIHWDEIQHRSLFFNHAEQTRRHAGYILEETPELALVHKTQFLTHFLDTLIGEIKHLFGFGNQRFVNPIGKVATAHLFDYGRKIFRGQVQFLGIEHQLALVQKMLLHQFHKIVEHLFLTRRHQQGLGIVHPIELHISEQHHLQDALHHALVKSVGRQGALFQGTIEPLLRDMMLLRTQGLVIFVDAVMRTQIKTDLIKQALHHISAYHNAIIS